MELSNYKDIFVFVEQRDREIQNVSYELISKARELAEKNNEQVVAVLLGYQMDAQLETLIHYGADRVLYASNSELDQYQTEPYAQAFTQIVNTYKPAVVLIGATTIGRDLAPRLSARIKTGLTADCTSLEMSDEGDLLMTRPALVET